jgi:hypothetical protein
VYLLVRIIGTLMPTEEANKYGRVRKIRNGVNIVLMLAV